MSKSLVNRLGAPLVVFFLTFAPAAVHAAEDLRKVTVVSFGLFGGQDVFRSEATGAAQIVASRFGDDPVVVRFNTKTGGGATVEPQRVREGRMRALQQHCKQRQKNCIARATFCFSSLPRTGPRMALLSRPAA